MKRLCFLIITFLGTIFSLSAQDTIVKVNGEEIYCRILKESSSKVYYYRRLNGIEEQNNLNRDEIQAIKYFRYKRIPVSHAQRTFIGFGMGIDFGGLGMNVTHNLTNAFGAYIGAGYAFAGAGVNGGVTLRLVPKKPENRAVPYITAMYGYNAAIAVQNAKEYNKMFYGPSAGLGIELRARSPRVSCWTFALIIPFRGSEVQEYMDELKNNHNVEFQNELMPVGFSIGYRFSP